jgi:hypothetical protein
MVFLKIHHFMVSGGEWGGSGPLEAIIPAINYASMDIGTCLIAVVIKYHFDDSTFS